MQRSEEEKIECANLDYQSSFSSSLMASYQESKMNQTDDQTSLFWSVQRIQAQTMEIKPLSPKKNHILTKNKRSSYAELQENQNIKVQNLIREDLSKSNQLLQKIIEEDETYICSSDIYRMESRVWKNREMIDLTTLRFNKMPLYSIIKLKIKAQQPIEGYYIFRATTRESQINKQYAIRKDKINEWFSNTIWACLTNIGYQIQFKQRFVNKCEGNILKKSEILGKWDVRYVTIDLLEGLISYHEKQSISTLKIKSIKDLWTRLEIVRHNGGQFLVIKLWALLWKYQFGIPIRQCGKWLQAFASLVHN